MDTQLQFKFKPRSTKRSRDSIIRQLRETGDVTIRQLFQHEESDLRDLYSLRFSDKKLTRVIRKLLQGSDVVEFVEGPILRKLTR